MTGLRKLGIISKKNELVMLDNLSLWLIDAVMFFNFLN